MQLHCLVLGCLIGKTSYEFGMSEHGEYREMTLCNNVIVMLSNFATRAPEQNLVLARDGAEFTDVLARLCSTGVLSDKHVNQCHAILIYIITWVKDLCISSTLGFWPSRETKPY